MCNQRNECKSVLGASAINRTSITPFVSTNVPTSQPISVCIHAYTYVFIYFAILTLGHENRRFDRPTCCNSLTGRRSIVTVLHLFFARGSDVRIGGHEFQVRSVRPEQRVSRRVLFNNVESNSSCASIVWHLSFGTETLEDAKNFNPLDIGCVGTNPRNRIASYWRILFHLFLYR